MNLYNFYKQYNELVNTEVILSFTKQMASALKFLHRLFIIHADLKPENIMITNIYEKKFKLIDMGSCVIKSSSKRINFYIVSRYYRAPELVYEKQFNEKIDMWSLGCIIFELFTDTPLFYAKNNVYLKEILYGFGFSKNVMKKLNGSKEYNINSVLIKTRIVEMLIFLLEFNTSKRFSAQQCLDHRLLLDIHDPFYTSC